MEVYEIVECEQIDEEMAQLDFIFEPEYPFDNEYDVREEDEF